MNKFLVGITVSPLGFELKGGGAAPSPGSIKIKMVDVAGKGCRPNCEFGSVKRYASSNLVFYPSFIKCTRTRTKEWSRPLNDSTEM